MLENVLEKNIENDQERLKRTALKSSVKILKIIEHDPFITIPKIAELIGISTRAIDKNIESLKKNGYIERIGPNKGGQWKLIYIQKKTDKIQIMKIQI